MWNNAFLLQSGEQVIAAGAWLWGWIKPVAIEIVALLIFIRLWRVQGIRQFLSTITGVTELQKGNIGLLNEQVTLLTQQKKYAEEQRDEYKGKWEREQELRAIDAKGWAEDLASVQREADGRRIVNDQDTLVIGIYQRLHGIPDEVAELIERRRAEALQRARERLRDGGIHLTDSGIQRIGLGGHTAGDAGQNTAK